MLFGFGESAGLAAAAFWACSSLFYSRTPLTAWQINFGKNVVAAIILCVHLALVTQPYGRPMFASDGRVWMLLTISSVVGILIGDTLYFRSLQILGPRRALMVSMTSPVLASAVGWIILGEPLLMINGLGILMTLGGVLVVIAERSAGSDAAGLYPSTPLRGILAGLGGAMCNAGGATFSHLATHPVKDSSQLACDPLEATVIRVLVAAIASLLTALFAGRLIDTATKAFRPRTLKMYLPAIVCGPWLGIWMSQIAYGNTKLAVATTLTCTTPLFALPLVRFAYGVRMTPGAVAGTILAIAGIFLTAYKL